MIRSTFNELCIYLGSHTAFILNIANNHSSKGATGSASHFQLLPFKGDNDGMTVALENGSAPGAVHRMGLCALCPEPRAAHSAVTARSAPSARCRGAARAEGKGRLLEETEGGWAVHGAVPGVTSPITKSS